MLVFRILSTVFLGLSCITSLMKNINMFGDNTHQGDKEVIGFTIYGWLWRAFVIVSIWLI